jgi:FixJ family two-component response regulator
MNGTMTSSPARGIETVYVVDDDASMRRALERMFRTAGFAVRTFDSAAAFLAHDKDAIPSCAVLDVRMPAVDGLGLHARLKDARRALPVVFITGHGDVPTSVRAMKTGAIDFIEKPFADEDLIAAVRTALDASRGGALAHEERVALEGRVKSLTPREREVFVLVAQGLPNKTIGARLGIAEKTIKVHRGRVMDKMAAGSLADLVRIAGRLGLTK